MKMSLNALRCADFTFSELTGVYISSQTADLYDYTKQGRRKNIIYYCESGRRHYEDAAGKPLFTVSAGDALFVADGAHYSSRLEAEDAPSSGIVIGFWLQNAAGEPIDITDTFQRFPHAPSRTLHTLVDRLYLQILQNRHALSVRATFYQLLEALLVGEEATPDGGFEELTPAVDLMMAHPEQSVTVQELAQLCHMSESSFAHKFVTYSGGIAPLQFRNRIRLMRAEEMAGNANLTVEDIARTLGFYDASYLCRFYKKHTGRTLKKR